MRESTNLQRVLDVTRQMAVTNDLDALLSLIVEAACQVLDCDRATIYLYDGESDELFSRVAKGIDAIRFPADRGVAGSAAQERATINVRDAYADERFNPDVDRETGYQTRSILALPLENLERELIGVLQMLNKRGGATFDAVDEEIATALGAQAGVALHRARLLEEYADKQRMQRDLEIARRIQQAHLPEQNPTVAGYDIAGWNQPADETGGDVYDFIPLADGRLVVILADATGHGISAALVIAQCRSLLRAMFSVTDDLARIAERVNAILTQDLSADRFVTAFVGILDPVRHTLEYITAGQGPLLFAHEGAVESQAPGGPPFSVLDDFANDGLQRFAFAPGDTVALLTDGFYETENAAEEQFGERRVSELILQPAATTCDTIARLHEAVTSFRGSQPQADDLTAILIRRSGA